MKPKALFKHDCDKCKYLGTMYVPSRNTMADVYRSCEKEIKAVIFRYSDDEPDYSHHHIDYTDLNYLFMTREEFYEKYINK